MKLTRRHMMIGSGALFGFTASGLVAPFSAPLAASLNTAEPDNDAAITVRLNQIRREHGISSVIMHRQLQHVALYQAELMAKHGKLKHSVGFGKGLRARLHKGGVHAMAAENIAAGQRNYEQAFSAWLRSSGHRRNMLDPDFAYYGLASATSDRRPHYPYWVLVLSR